MTDKRKNRPVNTTKISVTLSVEAIENLEKSKVINKSMFINWLLEEYYKR